MKRILVILLIISILQIRTISQVVCSEDELIQELKEDIEYNGKLNCLRESYPVPDESEEQKRKRELAMWNGDCSFEAENIEDADWLKFLQQNYGLNSGLVDVDGKPVPKDFDEQADMCEIVRALVASGKFTGINDVQIIPISITNEIDCAGQAGSTEVCAATAGSFADKQGWNILLTGQSIRFSGEPMFELAKEDELEEKDDE